MAIGAESSHLAAIVGADPQIFVVGVRWVRVVAAAAGQFAVIPQDLLGNESFFGLHTHRMALREMDGHDPLILIVASEAQGIGPAHRLSGGGVFFALVGSYPEGEVSLGIVKAVALCTIVIVWTGSVNNGRCRKNRQGGNKEESPSHRVLLVNGSGIGFFTNHAKIGVTGRTLRAITTKGN